MPKNRKSRRKSESEVEQAPAAAEDGQIASPQAAADPCTVETAAIDGQPPPIEPEVEAEPSTASVDEQSELDSAADQASPEDDLCQGNLRLPSILESLIFAADKPIATRQLRQVTGASSEEITDALNSLKKKFSDDSGIRLDEVGGGFHFVTPAENASWVRKLLSGRPARMSRAMLEVLSIVAYRQPVTRPEIEEIRGVDCGSTLRVLLERNLVRILGKKEEPGRPILYGTSPYFLEFFQLKALKELPSLKEFSELSDEHAQHVEEQFGGGPATIVEQPPEAAEPQSAAELRPSASDDEATLETTAIAADEDSPRGRFVADPQPREDERSTEIAPSPDPTFDADEEGDAAMAALDRALSRVAGLGDAQSDKPTAS